MTESQQHNGSLQCSETVMATRRASNNSGGKVSARKSTKRLGGQASAKEANMTTVAKHPIERNHSGQVSARKETRNCSGKASAREQPRWPSICQKRDTIVAAKHPLERNHGGQVSTGKKMRNGSGKDRHSDSQQQRRQKYHRRSDKEVAKHQPETRPHCKANTSIEGYEARSGSTQEIPPPTG